MVCPVFFLFITNRSLYNLLLLSRTFSSLSLVLHVLPPPMSLPANLHLLRWERRRQVGGSSGGWPAGSAAHHAGTLFPLFSCFVSLSAYPFLFSIYLLLLPFDTFSVFKTQNNTKRFRLFYPRSKVNEILTFESSFAPDLYDSLADLGLIRERLLKPVQIWCGLVLCGSVQGFGATLFFVCLFCFGMLLCCCL